MREITKKQAAEIARTHIVKDFRIPLTDVSDSLPVEKERVHWVRSVHDLPDCWYVVYSPHPALAMDGCRRLICIAKKTGKIELDTVIW